MPDPDGCALGWEGDGGAIPPRAGKIDIWSDWIEIIPFRETRQLRPALNGKRLPVVYATA